LLEFEALPSWVNIAGFAIAGLAIVFAGTRITAVADRLADVTGLGEAATGAVLLGAITSLSGIVTSVTAAYSGHPQLAVSNAAGGIAVQTLFIAIADFAYGRANLEHAAASATNLVYGTLLIALLSLPLIAHFAPPVTVWSVNPCTALLIFAYLFGLQQASKADRLPMWGPRETEETRTDIPDEPAGDRRTMVRLALSFVALAVVVGISGYVVAKSGIVIAERGDIAEGVVGAFLTGVVTSLPELVTTVSAVRRGALTLAVGGILGGNTFDVLFVAFSDIAYREGSIYHTLSAQQSTLFVVSILMTSVLILGLLRREKHGFANIGFESVLIIGIYIVGMATMAAIPG